MRLCCCPYSQCVFLLWSCPLSVAASSCNTHTQGTKASIYIRIPTNMCYPLTVQASGKTCGFQMVTTLNSCHDCTRPVCFSELSLAIPPWVGAMSTGQRAVMLCDWGVKADMVLFAGNTVWSISESVRGVCVDALYKSTFTYFTLHVHLLICYICHSYARAMCICSLPYDRLHSFLHVFCSFFCMSRVD